MLKKKKRPFFGIMGIARLLIIVFIGGAAFWIAGNVLIRSNRGEVAAYLRANALDVVELKDGRKSIGKIVGETPKSYFMKNTKGAEERIGRDEVKVIRKASEEELKIARILLARNTGRTPAQNMTISEKIRRMFDSMADEIKAEAKYYREVMAARQAKSNLERKLAEEKAKEQGAAEEVPIEQKLLQVISSGGTPARKDK